MDENDENPNIPNFISGTEMTISGLDKKEGRFFPKPRDIILVPVEVWKNPPEEFKDLKKVQAKLPAHVIARMRKFVGVSSDEKLIGRRVYLVRPDAEGKKGQWPSQFVFIPRIAEDGSVEYLGEPLS